MAALFSLLANVLRPHPSSSVDSSLPSKKEAVVVDPILHQQFITLHPCSSSSDSDSTMDVKVICPLRGAAAGSSSDAKLYKVTLDTSDDPRPALPWPSFRPSNFRCLKVFKKSGMEAPHVANEIEVSLMLSKLMSAAATEEPAVPIVKVLNAHTIDIGAGASRVAVSMELCEGGTLLDYMHDIRNNQRRRVISESEAIALFLPLAKALRFCHQNRVLHCDVRPENVLLESRGCLETARLTGFGRAIAMETTTNKPLDSISGSGLRLPEGMDAAPACSEFGNDLFVAPEVGYDGVYSPLSDVYALGALLLEALTGISIPYFDFYDWEKRVDCMVEHRIAERDRLRVWPYLSLSLKHLIRGMMCPDPLHRLTMNDVLRHAWISQPQTYTTYY